MKSKDIAELMNNDALIWEWKTVKHDFTFQAQLNEVQLVRLHLAVRHESPCAITVEH